MIHSSWQHGKLQQENLICVALGLEAKKGVPTTRAQTGLCYAFGQKSISRWGPASSRVPGDDTATATSHN